MENKILKIMSLLMMMLMIPISSFSANLNVNQVSNIIDFNQNNRGFTQEFIILGSDNSKSIGSQVGDLKLELRDLNQDIFIMIDNGFINNTFNITYVNNNIVSLNTSRESYVQELTMLEKGIYYIKVEPSFTYESVDVLVNFDDLMVTKIGITAIEPKGFDTIMSSFISVFIELFNINIAIWKVGYKLLISTIVLSFVSGLFGLAFLLFHYARKLNGTKTRRG